MLITTQDINILFEKNAEFLNATTHGKYSYHYGVMLSAHIFTKSRSHLKLLVPRMMIQSSLLKTHKYYVHHGKEKSGVLRFIHPSFKG
jgi:hypothetical protein